MAFYTLDTLFLSERGDNESLETDKEQRKKKREKHSNEKLSELKKEKVS